MTLVSGLAGGLEAIEDDLLTIDLGAGPAILPLSIEHQSGDGDIEEFVEVGFYREVNGDMVPDPVLIFSVEDIDWASGHWEPVEMTDSLGQVRRARTRVENGPVDKAVAMDIAGYAANLDDLIASRYLPEVERRVAAGEPVGELDSELD